MALFWSRQRGPPQIGGLVVAGSLGYIAVRRSLAAANLKPYCATQGLSCILGAVLAFFIGPERPSKSERTWWPGGPEGRITPAKSESEWIDASKKAIQRGDVRIWVSSVSVDFVPLKQFGQDSTSEKKQLLLSVRIDNIGTTKKVEYESWGDASQIFNRHASSLRDNFGNGYRQVSFGFATDVRGNIKQASIYPEKSVEDVLVFEPPLDNIEFLRLELAADAFGGVGTLRLQIPKEMIRR